MAVLWPLLFTLASIALARTDDDDGDGSRGAATDQHDQHSAIDRLKRDIFSLSADEISQRFGNIKARSQTPAHQQKIDHFVVLYMENHATDHFLGCMDLPGFDGIAGGHTIPIDPDDPTKGVVNVSCGTSPYVCTDGAPDYSLFDGKFNLKDPQYNPHIYPYSAQDDKYSYSSHQPRSTAVQMMSPAQLPVKSAIAQEFGVFNKHFTAVPSASGPNHLFTQSATSCGMQHNGLWDDCGGDSPIFPQFTIFDSLRLQNVSFGLFMNSTCGLDGQPCKGLPWTPSPTVTTPDVQMAGVARHKDRFYSQTLFYEHAANGTLPALSWLMPKAEACDHPCHDNAKGERLLKDVYEAVRAGPGWNRTLLIVAYDDAGGYYDHIVPPAEGVPHDESPCNLTPELTPPFQCNGPAGGPPRKKGQQFDFRRLGLRSTAMLISPWVAKGAVFQRPKGPFNTSQFELTSIPATVKNLFNLSTFLTKRDAWAGSYDELLLDSPRTDCPTHLPTEPPPATPWTPPPKLEADGRRRHLAGAAVSADGGVAPLPQHCSSIQHGGSEASCAGPGAVNRKQRSSVRLLSHLLGVPHPDVDAMDFADADEWITARWQERA